MEKTEYAIADNDGVVIKGDVREEMDWLLSLFEDLPGVRMVKRTVTLGEWEDV